ncbi:hypothetical protein AVDCRST_MAG84-929 [uncultured Microcoleus sp.]|uniref:Uncharacterized protein n=1 Tax=uncultured Microcoleus sp. TaxID=259945 RepID=A0A6J4KWQ7_9CYAN|nr:hypothetical protein AVDCRST_MAG84-929 [uncultured Microcoleus sp.]
MVPRKCDRASTEHFFFVQSPILMVYLPLLNGQAFSTIRQGLQLEKFFTIVMCKTCLYLSLISP